MFSTSKHLSKAEFKALQKQFIRNKKQQERARLEEERESADKKELERINKALILDGYQDAEAVFFKKKKLRKIRMEHENFEEEQTIKKAFNALGNIAQYSLSRIPDENPEIYESLSFKKTNALISYALGLSSIPKTHRAQALQFYKTKTLSCIKAQAEAQLARIPSKYYTHPRLWNLRALSRIGFIKSRTNYENCDENNKKGMDKIRCIDFTRIFGSYLDLQVECYDNEHTDSMKYGAIFHALNHIFLRNFLISHNDAANKLNMQNKSKKERLLMEITKVMMENEKEQEKQQEDNEIQQIHTIQRAALLNSEDQEQIEENYIVDDEEENEIPELQESTDFAQKIDLQNAKADNGELFKNFQDQGFTSAKVLILAPFKLQAVKILRDILYFCNNGCWKGVARKQKFKQEYNEQEYHNDCFRLGIKFTEEQIKLYENFTSADLVIASPLGIKTAKDANFDYLSSVQMIILYNAQALEFQNIQIVEEVLQHCNKIPSKHSSFNDINRIMPLHIEKKGAEHRQLIMLSEFQSLDQMYLFNQFAQSKFGRIEIDGSQQIAKKKTKTLQRLLQQRGLTLLFRKLLVKSIQDVEDAKFTFFTKMQWKRIQSEASSHTLILCSSYLDFMRLKRFFTDTNDSVGFISEYTDKKSAQRTRSYFESGRVRFLLFTERAFFFDKIMLRFVDNIVFYAMPSCPEVFLDVLDLLNPEKEQDIWKFVVQGRKKRKLKKAGEEKTEEEMRKELHQDISHVLSGTIRRSVVVLFSKYDDVKLRRVLPEGVGAGLLEGGDEVYRIRG